LPDSTLSIRRPDSIESFWMLLAGRDPARIGVEKEEKDHAERHQIHVDAEDDPDVVEVPAASQAADSVDGAGGCGERWKGQQHGGMVVWEVGER
jgi:hypothetical protein